MTAQTHAPASGPRPYLLARIGLLTGAAAAAALALLDLFTTVPEHDRIVDAADYAFTVDGFPLIGALLVSVAAIHSLHEGRDGRLGTLALILTTAGTIGFVPPLVASLFSADAESLGPLYLLSMLVSLVGVVLFAVALLLAKVLPWWAGFSLAVGWVVGGPVGEGGPLGFRGSALLLAAAYVAVYAAVAVVVSRRVRERAVSR
ncbi:hypothetical protein [Microbispora sp. ATCC PTA-5024]|uniref:hypothetical protein n=1 Tax=Microbispora sp. ATCC PTA-5024 TaxID=316330 RepID=UPI0003DC5052|nr:hypothetical protein [Microbispora sp. ATCC PTA-5024]ETK33900.1 hypothetical protein MPTA5024_22120 [Microbispora sp. ATCC PTA-5024]